MTKLNITVKDENSPYQFQGAYERNGYYSPVDFNNNTVAPDIENSYIQQNLPVRRQSLIVYHDKMRNSNEANHKRHSSLILPSTAHDKLCSNTRLSNSKSLNFTSNQPLTIQISQCDDSHTVSPTTSNSISSGSTDYSMDILFEDSTVLSTQKQQQPQKSPPKFIGRLRPSKSDTSNMYKKKKIRQLKSQDDLQEQRHNENVTTSPLSQSWNDMTQQPFSKLKSVLARLQTNSNEVNVTLSTAQNTANASSVKTKRNASKNMSSSNNEEASKKKKSKKSVVILDLPPAERKKKDSRKQLNYANMVYTALLSHVSKEFLKKIDLTTITFRDGIEYDGVFTGSVAVNCLSDILNTNDRNLALLVGRALENQGLFHHINYDYKLRDLESEVYQFQYIHRHYHQEVSRSPIPNQFIMNSSSAPATPKPLKKDIHNNCRQAPSAACETLPVHGVFSLLTDCYSPTCTRKTPCYSISCPRMAVQKDIIRRPLSIHFLKTEQEQLRSLWRHSVPLDIVMCTNNVEQKRQECIYELIYTEEDFTKDMHYVQDFWIEPILNSDIILPVERRNEFVKDVFWNLSDIVRISSALTKDLTARQDKHSVIPRIGDIMMNHVQEFQPFIIYGAHQIIGRHVYEEEKKRNAKFLQFVEKLERQPESRRLELNGYLTKPTSRLGRYNLLLNTIHQLTPKDHQDFKDIPKVMDMITELLVQLNEKVGYSDNKFHLKQISSKILPAKGSNHINTVNLDLLNPKRKLIMHGKMKRFIQHQHHSTIDHANSIQVFLFDHYLVICKIKIQDGLEHYKLYQKPISLSSLSVSIPNTVIIPSASANRRTSNIYNKISSNSFHTIPSSSPPTHTESNLSGFPITFHQKGTAIDAPFSTTLATTSESTRKLWMDKISELPGDKNQDFVIRINHNKNK